MDKILLAVVGLPGAGKTEATQYLVEKTKWEKIYFGQGVIDEVIRRGQEVNEANERTVREDLRKQHGVGAMAIINMDKIKRLYEAGNVIIESMYSWEEYLELKKQFGGAFKVLAVYSSPQVRTRRMSGRAVRPLTAEELVSRDYSQIENLHQAGPIARADFTIINEGSLEDLHKNIDAVMLKLHEG